MKFISFASSSHGNSAFISYKNTNILVDCGISRKRIVDSLAKYDKKLSDIDCIFVTHEHGDHIGGLPQVIKNNPEIKIISQKQTLEKILSACEKSNITPSRENFKIIHSINSLDENNYLVVKDIKVCPIKTSHDVPSVCYKFVLGDTKIAILTDIGVYTDYTLRSIKDVNYLMLECNYDTEMLMDNTNYNVQLKNRILGDGGHLSNVNCAEIIMNIANKSLKKVFLSHISDETNSEEYALEFVNKYLKENYKKNCMLPEINISKRLEHTIILGG